MSADTGGVSHSQQVIDSLAAENKLLSRRIEREQRIRKEAEEIGETGLRNLDQSRQELAFLSEITTMANQAGSARELLASALEYISRFAGWSLPRTHTLTRYLCPYGSDGGPLPMAVPCGRRSRTRGRLR